MEDIYIRARDLRKGDYLPATLRTCVGVEPVRNGRVRAGFSYNLFSPETHSVEWRADTRLKVIRGDDPPLDAARK